MGRGRVKDGCKEWKTIIKPWGKPEREGGSRSLKTAQVSKGLGETTVRLKRRGGGLRIVSK